MREQVSMKELPGWDNTVGSTYGRAVVERWLLSVLANLSEWTARFAGVEAAFWEEPEMLTFTSIWSHDQIGPQEGQETFAGKLVIIESRREDWEKSIAIGRNLGCKVHRLSQSHEVREVFCWSAMAGEREVPTHSYFAWWWLKSPYTRKRELGWVVKSLTCYFAAQLEKRWT